MLKTINNLLSSQKTTKNKESLFVIQGVIIRYLTDKKEIVIHDYNNFNRNGNFSYHGGSYYMLKYSKSLIAELDLIIKEYMQRCCKNGIKCHSYEVAKNYLTNDLSNTFINDLLNYCDNYNYINNCNYADSYILKLDNYFNNSFQSKTSNLDVLFDEDFFEDDDNLEKVFTIWKKIARGDCK